MVVIGIVTVMTSAAITVINPVAQMGKANDTRRKGDLKEIQKGLELYYNDNNAYPPNTPFGDDRINGIDWGNGWTPYVVRLPKDSGGRNYAYWSDGQSYKLYASLERASDPNLCGATLTTPCSGVVAAGVSCGIGTCNFGVSSPNVSP